MKWDILERTRCHEGYFFLDRYRLRHSLYSGGWSEPQVRELFSRNDAVAVLPYDPVRDRLVLIEQFRIGAMCSPQGPWLLEIVAGLIEPGERKDQVARREAMEEAGCELSALHHICDYYSSPGAFTERVALYLAKVDSARIGGIHGLRAEGEDIRVTVVDADSAFEMVSCGLIMSAMPIIALQWLQLNHERMRELWL